MQKAAIENKKLHNSVCVIKHCSQDGKIEFKETPLMKKGQTEWNTQFDMVINDTDKETFLLDVKEH